MLKSPVARKTSRVAARLSGAITAASGREDNLEWRDRLAVWHRDWAAKAGAAVLVLFRVPGEAMTGVAEIATIVTEGLEAILAPQYRQLAPALRYRGGSVRIYKGSLPSVNLVADPADVEAQIELFPAEARLEVRFPAQTPGETPPLVILVPTTGDKEPKVCRPEPVRDPGEPTGASRLVARFDKVVPGDYLVALEPQRRAENP